MAFPITRAAVSLILAVSPFFVCNVGASDERAAPARSPDRTKTEKQNPPPKPAPDEAARQLRDRAREFAKASRLAFEAQRAFNAADGDEEKRAAKQKLDQAQAHLKELRKNLEDLQPQPIRRINPLPPVRNPLGPILGQDADVSANTDPNDPQTRFLLLTAAGPVVVKSKIQLDGKPFRAAREAMIDDMMKAADSDGDGIPTWDEALSTGRFTLGRISPDRGMLQSHFSRMFDANSNGRAERAEVRRFVAQQFGGPAFELASARRSSGVSTIMRINGRIVSQSGVTLDLMKLLDDNGDGALSAAEMATAGEKLKQRDVDDNDLLDRYEVDGSQAIQSGGGIIVNRSSTFSRSASDALLLGPGVDANALYRSLLQHYGNSSEGIQPQRFSAVPGLFASLDENSDGRIQPEETLRLNLIPPHASLAMNLSTESSSSGVELTAAAKLFSKVNNDRGAVSLELPGAKLAFITNPAHPPKRDYSRSGTAYLARFDKDNSGFLEKDEVTGIYARLWSLWDDNQDGKVFPQEIAASYERRQRPQQTQIRAYTVNHGNSLFQSLDVNGDGRLSLREMMTAQDRIADFDKDHDGHLSRAEIPSAITVTFSIGSAPPYVARSPGVSAVVARKAKPTETPAWFARMDRNGDGDLTLKEFLGTEQQFDRLDLNHDGFIVTAEALAAEDEK